MSAPPTAALPLNEDARCDGCGDGDHYNGHMGWVPYAMTWCCSETGQHYEPLGWLCQKCKTKNWQFKGRRFLNEELYIPSAPAVQATADADGAIKAAADELLGMVCEHETNESTREYHLNEIVKVLHKLLSRKAVSPKAAQEEQT